MDSEHTGVEEAAIQVERLCSHVDFVYDPITGVHVDMSYIRALLTDWRQRGEMIERLGASLSGAVFRADNSDAHALACDTATSETRAVLEEVVEIVELFREAIDLAREDFSKSDGPIWETSVAMAIDSSHLKRLGDALAKAQKVISNG